MKNARRMRNKTMGYKLRHRMIKGLLAGMILLLSFPASAQLINNNRPAFWPSLAIRKSFGDHWKVKIEHSTRMQFMPFAVDELYFQGGAEYELNRNFGFEVNYRFSEVYDQEIRFTPAHRVSFEGDYKGRIRRWTMNFHPAVQAVFSRENQMKDRDAQWAFRPKFELSYNVRKSSLEPFASLEFYMGRRSGEGFSVYKYRLSAGLGGDITDHIKLTGYLRQQGGFFTTNLNSFTILGADLLYKF